MPARRQSSARTVAAIGYTSPFVGALDPGERLSRASIRNVVGHARASDADISMLIFAWGGMSVKNAKLILNSMNNWLPIVSGLRNNKFSYLEAYDRFLTQSLQGKMPGCGPAYYTKLIFLLTKHLHQRGFIMDQWLGRSITLLADREIVLFYQCRVRRPLKQRYVHKNNTCRAYDEFCNAVRNLTVVSGEIDPDSRIREENVEMRLFSVGRGKGNWRNYVIENDVLS
ncbi:8-oxoguanine DNA glycosylase OGG fold protein [Bradyrhizobium japonicum]|uniref:8-oxoguanine DNA glycosylase OGG fold protein n=1 Tax=Bradyrhizobium japonicum TaxID=375 RepID=UPI003211C86D